MEPESGIPLFLKIVTYDNSFHPGALSGVVVYLVYDKSVPHSYEQMLASHEFFRSNNKLRVSGLSIKVVDVTIDQLRQMQGFGDSGQYRLVLITDIEKSKSVSDVIAICQDQQIRSFTFEPEHVQVGVSVSIRPSAKKNRILINLPSAKAEGSTFGARFLSMCEILND